MQSSIGLSLISLHFLSKRACEATLQYQYLNIPFFLIYALFVESFIDKLKEMCIKHDM